MGTDATAGEFRSTLWSDVLRTDDPGALNRLCETYWKPVYVYLRRKGKTIEDAKDQTQGFFTHILEKDILKKVEKGRGRFRGFLLAVLEHWLANEYRAGVAEKRGGGKSPIPFDFDRGESEVHIDPADPATPEDAYRRSWGLAVLRGGIEDLRLDFDKRGLKGQYEAIRDHLAAAREKPSYEQTAERLECSVTDVTNLLHRARKKLQELIRARLRDTVESDSEADEELRDLFQSF